MSVLIKRVIKRLFRLGVGRWLTLVGVLSCSLTLLANPVLDHVSSGNVSVQQTPGNTTIHQTSPNAIINWQSFNIQQQEVTHFQQPAGGVALNRISPTQGPSSIYGTLTATGRIILVNPAGIFFGPSAYVNVGGLIATTGQITDKQFLSGQYVFTNGGEQRGAIVNEGKIIAANNGLVALVAPGVINNGMIQANVGHVVLASGEAFTVDLSGDQLINFTVTAPTSAPAIDKDGNVIRDGVRNTGQIYANGGSILITAKAASGVLDQVINMQGVAQAKSVYQHKGAIIISGDPRSGKVFISAKLNASGKKHGQKGGKIIVTGHKVLIAAPAEFDVSGYSGGGVINVGGSAHGKGPLQNSEALVVAPNTRMTADALVNGDGGEIVLWSDHVTRAYGTLSARGGALGGNGGWIETSSHNYLDINAVHVDTSAPHGTTGVWLLDPYNVTITNSTLTTNGVFDGGNPNIFTPTGNGSIVNVSDLQNNLLTANVTITTSGPGLQAGNITVSSPITWSSGNTLTLQADGDVLINAAINAASGVLQLIGININIAASLDGAFSLISNSTSSTTISSAIGGTTPLASVDMTAGSTIAINAGTVQTEGNQTYSGNVTLGANTNLTTTTSGDVHVTGNINGGNNQLTITDTGSGGSLDGVVSNLSSLTIDGLGYILMLGSNTYSGPTTVTSTGTLYLGNNNALGSSTVTVQNGGILGIAGSNLIVPNAINLNNGSTLLESNAFGLNEFSGNIAVTGTASLIVSGAFSDDLLLSGVISGTSITLDKQGSGSLILAGQNTFTGTTTVNGGALAIASSAGLGASSATATVAGGNSLILSGTSLLIPNAITFNNGSTLLDSNSSSANTLSGNLSLNGTNTINVGDATGFLTFSGTLSGSSITLDKIGSGTLALAGSNTFTGVTNVTAGTVNLQHSNALGNSSATAVVSTNAALTLLGNALTILNNLTVFGSGISGTGVIVDTSSNANNTLSGTITLGSNSVFSVSNSTTNLTMSGVITDGASSFSVTKLGSGSLTLSNGNTFDGSTLVNAGTLVASHNTALGTSSASVLAGATLAVSGSGLVINNPVTINSTGVGGAGALLNVSGSNTLSNTITLGSTNTSIGVSSGTLTLNGTLTQSGSGFNFSKSGNGMLTLNNTSSYTGTTTINAGTLNIGNANGLGTSGTHTSSVLVNNGGTLRITGVNMSPTLAITLNGAGVGSLGALLGSGSATWNGNVTLGSASTIGTVAGGNTLTVTGTINGASALTFTGAGSVTVTGAVGSGTALSSITSNSNLTLNGGVVTTTGAQSYNNPIVIGANTTFTTTNSLLSFSDIDRDATSARSLTASIGNATLNFNGNIGAGSNGSLSGLVLNTTGTTAINGNVNAGSLTTNAGGTTQIASGTIITTGNQAYNDNVVFTGSPTLKSGAGTIVFSGSASGIGQTLTLKDNTVSSTGSVTFNGNVTLQNLVTFGGSSNYAVSLLGGTNTFSSAVTFNNSNGVTLGNGGGDTFNFNGGVTSTASTTTVNGDILSNANALILGTLNIAGNTLLNSAGGAITVGTTNSNAANTNNLTLTANAGAITLNGSIGLTNRLNQFTATNSGAANDIVFNNHLQTASTILITAGRHVTLANGNVDSTSGNVTLTGTAGQVRETGTGFIKGAILTTSSVGGTTLNNANTISTFNATNTSGGALSLVNTAATLSVTNLSQSGSGAVSITNTGNIALNSNVAAGSGNAISLLASGTLATTGANFVSGGFLTTSSAGGTSLTNANTVTGFNATNNTTGAIALVNTSNPSTLSITGITQNASGNVTITNTGAVTTSGPISLNGGTVSITTLSPDANERALTINGTVQTNGGNINFNSANNAAGDTTALFINNTLNTTPGTGGTLTISSGLALNASPVIGAGNVVLQGNGLDLTLGTVNLSTNTNFNAVRFITVNGALTTSGGANLALVGDVNTIGVGGVWITSTGSVSSSGLLTLQGSSLAGLVGADANAGIQIDSGATVTGAGAVTATVPTGNKNIIIKGTLQSSGANAVTITPAGTGTIQLGGTVRTQGGTLTFNHPVVVTTGATVDSGSGTTTFNNTVTGVGQTLALQNNTSATGNVIFQNTVSLGSISTFAQPYAVMFNGSTNTFSNNVSFNHTNGLMLGNGGDVFNFNGGLTSTAGTTTFNFSQLNTTNDAISLGAVTLNANSTVNTGAGAIALGSVNGAFSLNLTSSAGSTLNGAITIASLLLSGSGNDVINASTITTTGTQSYLSALTQLVNSTLTGSSITISSGINGNKNLSLVSPSISVTGNLALSTLTLTGTGGANLFVLNNANAQTWTLSGSNTGSLATSGISSGSFSNIQTITSGSGNDTLVLNGGTLTGSFNAGTGTNSISAVSNAVRTWNLTGSNSGSVTGVAAYSNIQSLSGSSGNDTFILSGGTVSNGIEGNAGTNTLIANNVANTWNITGTNTGSVTGLSSFNNIQNLTGGNSGNTFNFADNASVTGVVDGTNLLQTNSIYFTAYSTLVEVILTSTHVGDASANSNPIVSFDNITHLFGNATFDNTITVPTGKTNSVVYTGQRSGYINDPLFFDNFIVNEVPPPPPPPPPVPPVPPGPTPVATLFNVSPIIEQPERNSFTSVPTISPSTPYTPIMNIDDIIEQTKPKYITCVKGGAVSIGLPCSSGAEQSPKKLNYTQINQTKLGGKL